MDMDKNCWGKEVIEKALRYANHEWYATEKNVMHGIGTDGRWIDTPDVTWQGRSFCESRKPCYVF